MSINFADSPDNPRAYSDNPDFIAGSMDDRVYQNKLMRQFRHRAFFLAPAVSLFFLAVLGIYIWLIVFNNQIRLNPLDVMSGVTFEKLGGAIHTMISTAIPPSGILGYLMLASLVFFLVSFVLWLYTRSVYIGLDWQLRRATRYSREMISLSVVLLFTVILLLYLLLVLATIL